MKLNFKFLILLLNLIVFNIRAQEQLPRINLGLPLTKDVSNIAQILTQIENLVELPSYSFTFYYNWSYEINGMQYLISQGIDSNFSNIGAQINFPYLLADSGKIILNVHDANSDMYWIGERLINITKPIRISQNSFCNNQNLYVEFTYDSTTNAKYSIVYPDSVFEGNPVPITGTSLWQDKPLFYPIISDLRPFENVTKLKFELLIKNEDSAISYKKEYPLNYAVVNAPILPLMQYNCESELVILTNNFVDNLRYSFYRKESIQDVLISEGDLPVYVGFLQSGKYFSKVTYKDESGFEICGLTSNVTSILNEIDEMFVFSNKSSLTSELDTAILYCSFTIDSVFLPLVTLDWYKDDVFYVTSFGNYLLTSTPGVYYAKYVNSCGVESNTDMIDLPQGLTSILRNSKENEPLVKIFPNPFENNKNKIKFSKSLYGKPIFVKIMDVQGKSIFTQTIIAKDVYDSNISIGEPGNYIIQFLSNGEVLHTQKIIIK